MRITSVFIYLVVVLVWIKGPAHSSSSFGKLRFISDQNFTHEEQFKKTRLGGLSGLAYDPKQKVLLVASDDGGKYGPARYYVFGISLTKDKLSVYPKDVVFLKNPFGKFFKERTVDFEGITLLPDGNLLLSTEGNNKLGIGTSLFEFQRSGSFVKAWPVPGKFKFIKINKMMKSGIRNNQGFESLTSTPDGKTIFTANQTALYQDGVGRGGRGASPVRIIKYVDRLPKGEYVYLTDRHSALADLVALDSSNLLALERSYSQKAKLYKVKIYHVAILKSTTDVSNISALMGKKWRSLSKELALDLDEIVSKITYKNKKLDNIEGMCLGPLIKSGNRTLILVSDNNFSKRQRTTFMAFEIMQ